MIYRFGDVLLVPFSFTNQSVTKKRPAVVISSNQYNQRHTDVILIAVTSQNRVTAYPDSLQVQDWQQASLLKPSVIKPVITTIQSSLILKKLGILSFTDQQGLKRLIEQMLC